MRFHQLQNVGTALDFLQKERKIKLVNIRNEEIVDGNPKLILGLVWTLILHFQVGKPPSYTAVLGRYVTYICTSSVQSRVIDTAREFCGSSYTP